MPKIEGVAGLNAKLQAKLAAAAKESRVSAVVGYTQQYSLHVHENLEAFHSNGQAKFLEQPAREMRGELGDMIKADLKKGMTMTQALLRAALRLQRESQLLCPVQTGALRASAFTRIDEGD